MQAQGTTQAVPGVQAMGMTSLQPQIPSLGMGTGYSSGHPANAENSMFNCCFHKSSEPVGAGLSQQFEPINPVLCPLEASEVMCPPEGSVWRQKPAQAVWSQRYSSFSEPWFHHVKREWSSHLT